MVVVLASDLRRQHPHRARGTQNLVVLLLSTPIVRGRHHRGHRHSRRRCIRSRILRLRSSSRRRRRHCGRRRRLAPLLMFLLLQPRIHSARARLSSSRREAVLGAPAPAAPALPAHGHSGRAA